MLTPIHTLLAVYIRKRTLQLAEQSTCPERIRHALFETMAFFFPKVHVFKSVSNNESESSMTDNSATADAAPVPSKDIDAISDSCTEVAANSVQNISIPDDLEVAISDGLRVCQELSLFFEAKSL